MGFRVRCVGVLATCALAALPATALASSGPTRAQIRKAIDAAEASRDLWATINICNSKRFPREIGIRGQMPSLGFKASLGMKIDVEYQPSPKRGFKPSGLRQTVGLGPAVHRLLQGGARWKLMPNQGLLRGSITFVWWIGHTVLGQTTRTTTGRHHDAAFGDPPRFSAAVCDMP